MVLDLSGHLIDQINPKLIFDNLSFHVSHQSLSKFQKHLPSKNHDEEEYIQPESL